MSNDVVIAELKRIADEHGGALYPRHVVAAARSKSSPLHSRFEWDNTAAAEKYRLAQARSLISVAVEYLGNENEGRMTRVFVSLTPSRPVGGGYLAVGAVMQNPAQRDQLLADAFNEFARFREKYSDLRELAGVFAAMDRVAPPPLPPQSPSPRRRRKETTVIGT